MCEANIIWVIKSSRKRWVGHNTHMGQTRGAYRIWVWESEWKRPLGWLSI